LFIIECCSEHEPIGQDEINVSETRQRAQKAFIHEATCC